MTVILIEKKTNPLLVRFKTNDRFNNEPVLFIWEDSLSKNIKHIDEICLSQNLEYYSGINKNISFFENGITFKIISLKDYKCLYSYDFKNVSFISGKNILYISQNSYTGYSYAARNYIYQLLQSDYNVQWSDKFTTSNFYKPVNEEEQLVFSCLNNKIDYDSVIIHHTPESWKPIFDQTPRGKKVYGLTTWETTRLHPVWVDFINNSVDEVIVPSKFNIDTFKYSGVSKPLNLWYHDVFSFQKSSINVINLFNKFVLFNGKDFSHNAILIKNITEQNTVYYNISQFVNRKNIQQVINSFCKKFTYDDKVCLFVKTYIETFSQKEINALKYKIVELTRKFTNLPKIIFCFENLNNEEINTIHEIGDVYFTLNRGEGFGLCTYTAKKIGNRIICGKFGAEKEFLDDNDLLLDYELGSSDYLDNHNKFYIGHGQQCAFYDTDYVVSKLEYFSKTIKTKYNII
jgi:hypothetical protein